jgi:EpsI family protein
LAAGYLFWEKRGEFQRLPATPSWFGFAALAIGFGFFWLGELSGELFTQYLSFWLVVVGILWSVWGRRRLASVFFPVALLLAMFPPPHFLHNQLTFNLKLVSTHIGVWMLQLYGMSAYQEGNIIDLDFTRLQVVDACSGLRYLFPLLIMAVLLAYFYRAALWKKSLLVLSAVPLTVLTNSFRIAATGVLYEIWGPAAAEGFFHGFSGWLVFIFGLALLLLEMGVLKKIFPEEKFSSFKDAKFKVESETELKAESSTIKTDAASDEMLRAAQTAAKENARQGSHSLAGGSPPKNKSLNLKPAAGSGIRSLLHPPQFIAAVVLLAATLAAAQGIEFREMIPLAKSFAEFPTQVGEWTGRRDAMGAEIIETLDLSDYVIVNFANGSHSINFYTAYYESQRKGESIHSPETCLPGSGWEFKNAGKARIPLSGPTGSTGQTPDGPTASMTVNKAFMEKGSQKQLSYFWFPQRDRVLTNAWELKLYNFWDALTRQRTDGALVRLITPVYPNETAAQAENRLTDFTRLILPVLNDYLPR